jgi:hypothetical protein
MYIIWLLYIFSVVPKIVKIVLTVLVCLNVQLCAVFWASVNSLETDKYLLYDVLLTVGVYLLLLQAVLASTLVR